MLASESDQISSGIIGDYWVHKSCWIRICFLSLHFCIQFVHLFLFIVVPSGSPIQRLYFCRVLQLFHSCRSNSWIPSSICFPSFVSRFFSFHSCSSIPFVTFVTSFQLLFLSFHLLRCASSIPFVTSLLSVRDSLPFVPSFVPVVSIPSSVCSPIRFVPVLPFGSLHLAFHFKSRPLRFHSVINWFCSSFPCNSSVPFVIFFFSF